MKNAKKGLKIRHFSEDDADDAVKIWNSEFSDAYQNSSFSSEQFKKKTFENNQFDRLGSFVALNNSRIIGFIISFCSRELETDSYWHLGTPGWIGAVAIDSRFKQQGIGTKLLEEATDYHRKWGRILLLVGGGEGISNFFPGIDTRWKVAINFFRSNGFQFLRRTCHVNRKLGKYKIPGDFLTVKENLKKDGIEIGIAKLNDGILYKRFLSEKSSRDPEGQFKKWEKEPSSWIFAKRVRENRIVGKVGPIYVKGAKGGYGGIYTLPNFRGKGIGKVMLSEAVLRCKEIGAKEMPLWTRPHTMDVFYSKLGFKTEVEWDVYAKALPQDVASDKWAGRWLIKGFSP